MARPPDSLDHALTFVRAEIDAAHAQGQERLPSLRQLSRQAGVSQTTMLKAVGLLRDQGVLRTVTRRGTLLTGAKPSQGGVLTAPQAGQKWRVVADALRRELLAGTFSPGQPVPSHKTLAGTHRANYRTMRKALQQLHREGYLALAGRRYAAAFPAEARPGSRVLLITRAELPLAFELMDGRKLELLRELELQCLARRLRTEFVFCHYTGTTLHVTPEIAASAAAHGASLAGSVLWTAGFSRDQLGSILRQLEPLGLPVAAVDEARALEGPDALSLRTMRAVSLGTGSACGRDMGRYLLRLGHRRVLYLGFSPLPEWSAARLQGLREAFAEAGIADGVTEMTVGPETPEGFGGVPFYVDRLNPSDEPPYGREETMQALRRVEALIVRSVLEVRRAPRLARALTAALRVPGVTAWVASHDELAIACLSFLEQQRVEVPQKLSLVSFDDTPQALYHGLTSFSFGLRAIAARLVDTVLTSPAILKRGMQVGAFEAPGTVSERRSSGRVAAV